MMIESNLIEIKGDFVGRRLDKVVLELVCGASFGEVNKWCRSGQIRLDGKRVKGRENLKKGQVLRLPPPVMSRVGGEKEIKIKLNDEQRAEIGKWIVFEKEDFLVLNKPAGIPVQAGSGHFRSVDRLLEGYFENDENVTPKLVHRIDKNTSGCLVVAKNRRAAMELGDALKARRVVKKYLAVVSGDVGESFVVDGRLKKIGGAGAGKVVVAEDGQAAKTEFTLLKKKGRFSLVEARPLTGRTHQIRVHLAHVDAPIVGDFKYGGEEVEGLDKGRFLLHAAGIGFEIDGKWQEFEVDVADDFFV